MKDRVFPTLQQDGNIASETEFAGINWNNFVQSCSSGFKKEASSLPDGFDEILTELTASTDVSDDKLVMAEKEDEDSGDTEDEEIVEGVMEKKGRGRKVHFSSADQISADAIEKAKESGSEELVNAILAARKQRRIRLAQKAELLEKEQDEASVDTEVLAAIQKRDDYRRNLIASIDAKMKRVAGNSSKIKISVSKPTAFKKVASLGAGERKAFAETAIANGFPEEYVLQMLGDSERVETANVDTEQQIRQVMASNLDSTMKKSVLEGMIKTAKLDQSQKQRIIDYWINELKYGDKEWVTNWINKNYD